MTDERKPKVEPELHGFRFSKQIKIRILSFRNIETKTLGVRNVELYQHEKMECEICINSGYTKKTNLTKFKLFKVCIDHRSRSTLLSFFICLKYK